MQIPTKVFQFSHVTWLFISMCSYVLFHSFHALVKSHWTDDDLFSCAHPFKYRIYLIIYLF